MLTTISARAVRSRLLNLSEKAHDLSSAWYAGVAYNRDTWPAMAARCHRMAWHFQQRAERLAAAARRLL